MSKASKNPAPLASQPARSKPIGDPVFSFGKIREDASPLDLVFAMFSRDEGEEGFLEAVVRCLAKDLDFMGDALDMSGGAADDVADALHTMSTRLTVCLEFERRRRGGLEATDAEDSPKSGPRSRKAGTIDP